ncbi:hypothetical protein PABG_02386 [Paracoccidioides brasiliensis Pb03]|uniref:Uncharacterized protein n=1 Tax=Paracoccidioides brasiliensis (strain Pb18) TaxID=502780 RepID=C1G1K6_PARBD|nr:uncharacterized protein PADG_00746 [Paracoccidioides brasiliensis Pb18]EEH20127.2 hypothetical protein PABG_02386 [Paracoccidioides brasiliensis Pb03]EEH44457.2 hypothetical protein PADG_00746 [Paracoccidioides brasiliensis Pb18]ODH46712.1 hypothetical protein GX48_07217 [Paracoccidioides brasiliensis]
MVKLWTSNNGYKECDQSDGENEGAPRRSKTHFCWAALFITLLSMGALLLVLAPRSWIRRNECICSQSTSGSKEPPTPSLLQTESDLILDCGTTRAEAVARGCVFDVMAAAWLPRLCYDEDAARESMLPDSDLATVGGSGPFPWWTSHNHSVEIPQDSLTLVDELVGYTWERYHMAHCLYDWRVLVKAAKRIRAGERNVYVHVALLNYHHAYHCSQIIANQDHRVGAKSKVDFALGRCVRLDIY